MKHPFILSAFEKLEKVAGKLPSPIQKAILSEVTPLKNSFLRRRIARVILLGDPLLEKKFVLRIFSDETEIAVSEPDGLEMLTIDKHPFLQMLDARSLPLDSLLALGVSETDILLFVREKESAAETLSGELDRCATLLSAWKNAHPEAESPPALFGVFFGNASGGKALHASLLAKPEIAVRVAGSESFANGEDRIRLLSAFASALPDEAKLELARSCKIVPLQREIARALSKSLTAISGALGMQPIPFADFPLLFSLQIMLVSGIIYISGREMSKRLALQFFAALGLNFGAGMALRQGSRAALKLLPGFGNAVSGAIAGAGTFAIGRAASAYFIDKETIAEARKLLWRSKKKALPPK